MASLMDLVAADCNCTFQGTGIGFGDLNLSDEFKEEWMGFIRFAENDSAAREFTQYYFEVLQQCNLEIQKEFEEIDNFSNSTLQFLKNAPLIIRFFMLWSDCVTESVSVRKESFLERGNVRWMTLMSGLERENVEIYQRKLFLY